MKHVFFFKFVGGWFMCAWGFLGDLGRDCCFGHRVYWVRQVLGSSCHELSLVERVYGKISLVLIKYTHALFRLRVLIFRHGLLHQVNAQDIFLLRKFRVGSRVSLNVVLDLSRTIFSSHTIDSCSYLVGVHGTWKVTWVGARSCNVLYIWLRLYAIWQIFWIYLVLLIYLLLRQWHSSHCCIVINLSSVRSNISLSSDSRLFVLLNSGYHIVVGRLRVTCCTHDFRLASSMKVCLKLSWNLPRFSSWFLPPLIHISMPLIVPIKVIIRWTLLVPSNWPFLLE